MLKPGKFGNKNAAVQLNKLSRLRNVTKLGSHLNSLRVLTGQSFAAMIKSHYK